MDKDKVQKLLSEGMMKVCMDFFHNWCDIHGCHNVAIHVISKHLNMGDTDDDFKEFFDNLTVEEFDVWRVIGCLNFGIMENRLCPDCLNRLLLDSLSKKQANKEISDDDSVQLSKSGEQRRKEHLKYIEDERSFQSSLLDKSKKMGTKIKNFIPKTFRKRKEKNNGNEKPL